MDMMDKIHNLKHDEIDSFINKRLSELKNTEKKIVGLNSNNYIYPGFFDENVRINISAIIKEKNKKTEMLFAGLCVNDINIYKYLINACKDTFNPYTAVCNAVDDYLQLNNPIREEYYDDLGKIKSDALFDQFYGKNISIPIEIFNQAPIGVCTEVATVAQNMFRFLDIESDFVCGKRIGYHAFNIIYPRGRENNAVLFDGNHPVNWDSLCFLLNTENKEKLFSGEEISLTDREDMSGAAYLFGFKIRSFKPFSISYSIHNADYVDGDNFSPSIKKNEVKLVFRNHYKKNINVDVINEQ